MARLYVVGTGPGDLKQMTYEAREALEAAEVVIGYKTYLDLIAPLLWGKEVVSSGMRGEVERCREALLVAAEGRTVALVSGGDAGIYGMAGLVLELLPELQTPPEVVVVPGVSAVQAAAAVLGAPLMHDFAVISLSDLLTPWSAIERRIVSAAVADFVVALYNPRGRGRVTQLEQTRRILLSARSAATPVGIVRNALRPGQERTVTTLADMLDHEIDMFSLVIVGNTATYIDPDGRMVTPRGYAVRSDERDARSESPLPHTPHPSLLAEKRGGALFVGGTGSDVGKSVIAAGLCRILKRRGLSVAPFKSQNMALNSAVTPEGGEIGRAQAVQAEACGIPPHTDMNPVLLKPSSDTGSQVIVQGKAVGHMRVAEYQAYKPEAFARVRESFARLRGAHDFVVIEGAGSIAEINLKAHDIANLKIAEMARCPAILVADIDRGGVFAQIVGTLELLEPDERQRVRGVIINRFRGDPSLLTPGIEAVERRTGVPVLGVVPHFTSFRLPEEDSVALERRVARQGEAGDRPAGLAIGVVRLPRISNYTDFDPLEREPDVTLRYVTEKEELAGLDLLILPGSKATVADLAFLRDKGLFDAIRGFGGAVAGICGGYQMLGRSVSDPEGVESDETEAAGLGLLDAETVMRGAKETHRVEACLMPGGAVVAPDCHDVLGGYEIHMGETSVGPGSRPFARIVSRGGQEAIVADGAVSPDGRVFGTYLHGIFDNAGFRSAFLNRLRREKGLAERAGEGPSADPFDLLADHLERHLDMGRLLALCGVIPPSSSPSSTGGD